VQSPAEIILVDDASDDGTLEILRQFEHEYAGWVHVITLPENRGVAAARNAGWHAAKQPYIAFLDSDDAWHPLKLAIQYEYMQKHPDVILSGHAYRQMNDGGKPLNWNIDDMSGCLVSRRQILLSNRFVTPSVMLKRDIPFRFNEVKRHMEDHLLWAEIACSGLPVVKLSAELAVIYKAPFGVAGLSSQMWAMAKADVQNYACLHRKGLINMWQWLGLSIYSSLKFIRRLFVCLCRDGGGE